MSEKLNIEELVRTKLGDAELSPSARYLESYPESFAGSNSCVPIQEDSISIMQELSCWQVPD